MFEEIKELLEITNIIKEQTAQVKWRLTVLKDGEVISARDHYRLYTAEQKDEFLADTGAEGQKYVVMAGW